LVYFIVVLLFGFGFLIFNVRKPIRTEQNRFGLNQFSVRSGPVYINKECYFSVRLNFWVKTGPNRTVNTPSYLSHVTMICFV
jgi:hypothetical protein